MIALINKSNGTGDSLGTIVSFHRTTDAAVKADERLQKRTKGHVPTTVREVNNRLARLMRKGDHISPLDAIKCENLEGWE